MRMRLRPGALVGLSLVACSALTNLSELATIDADAGDAGDAAPTGGFKSPEAWSTFDVASVTPAAGFAGAAFDGRYLYLAPVNYVVVRYDTQAPFGSTSSWAVAPSVAQGPFAGTAFDGRFVYFIPTASSSGVNDGVVRFDTQAAFDVATSWSVFHTATINPNAKGFWGGVFDGRFLYLAPYTNTGNASDGVVARYDTQGSFTTAWDTFDTTAVNAGAQGFTGAIFDGHYVYFVPYVNASAAPDGVVARYDTDGGFDAGDAWTTFDTTSLSGQPRGFGGGAYDGRYLYLAPYIASPDGVVARYDTKAAFGAPAAWSTFDLSVINAYASQLSAPAFDGRYVYFARYTTGVAGAGIISRYDTASSSFGAQTAWDTFDTTTVNPSAARFSGGAFDGRYVYFIPAASGVVARFDAVNPPSLPTLPGWHGSFF